MPRVLASAFNSLLSEPPSYTLDFIRPQAVRHSRFASFFGGGDDEDNPSDESIDDPPDQQMWPDPIPHMRKTDAPDQIMKFITGHSPPKPEEKWGKDARELEPSIKWSHEEAQKADEYAVEAQEAAEDAVRWDKGIVHAVDVADQAWDGAVYAKRVTGEIEKLAKELDLVVKDRHKISDEINEFETKAEHVVDPSDSFGPASLNGRIHQLERVIMAEGKVIKPFQQKKLEPFMEFLHKKDHPPLFPPPDGPGMKDGHVAIPLHFPDDPDPMVLEEYMAPDVQARMPPGTLPLDMSTLKGVA